MSMLGIVALIAVIAVVIVLWRIKRTLDFDTRRGEPIASPGITFAITGPWRNGAL